MNRSTILTDDGAWTWFNDPRAIYHDGQILTGWVNRRGDIQFGTVELATHRTTVLTLHPAFQADDHDNPALLKNPDGTITALFARHGGSDVYVADVTRSRDATWTAGAVRTVPKHPNDPPGDWGWAYANPFRLTRDGSLCVASRGPNFNPVLRTHRDGAWRAAINLVINPGARPYVKYHSDGVDRIGFAYTDAHPLGHTNNVYYAYLNDGVFRRADGSMIKRISDGPLTMHDSQSAIVFDHTANPCVTGDSIGIAYEFDKTDTKADFAFSVVAVQGDDQDDEVTLAHELGHNLGAGHDAKADDGDLSNSDAPAKYANGYIFKGDNGHTYRDVMSYGNSTIIPFFSTPRFTYKGVPIGNATNADNARIIRELAPDVAAYA